MCMRCLGDRPSTLGWLDLSQWMWWCHPSFLALPLGSLGEIITACRRISEANPKYGTSLVLALFSCFLCLCSLCPSFLEICQLKGYSFSTQPELSYTSRVSPGLCSPSHLTFHVPRPLKIFPWGLFSHLWSHAPFRNQAWCFCSFVVHLWLSFLSKVQIWLWIMYSLSALIEHWGGSPRYRPSSPGPNPGFFRRALVPG